MAKVVTLGGMLGVHLVGAFAVTRDGVAVDRAELGSRKGRELLKLLAVDRGHVVSVEHIVDVLWLGAPPTSPAASIATLVSRLRAVLGREIVAGDRGGYQLGRAPAVRVDLDDAAGWIEEGERRLAAGEPGLGVAAATRAADTLAGGGVLVEEPSAEWAEPARAQFADLLRRSRLVLAEAALAVGDIDSATRAAGAAVAADPFDERSRRALMRSYLAAAEPARALAAYAELHDLLASELGADPAAETRELHLAALREDPPPTPTGTAAAVSTSDTIGLVGRADQLRRLRAAWNACAAGQPGLLLVVGEAGIGKTRLVEELARIASSTGGTVLSSRCYATERSLFLQPVVDAVAAVIRTLPPDRLVELAGDHGPALARLFPDAAAVLGPPPSRRDTADLERRRAFDGLMVLVKGLCRASPVLLALDDVQNAGRSTIELLHYLARHTAGSRLLIIGTVRDEEGVDVLESLDGVAVSIGLGPLSSDAVASLAAAAGQADHADDIMKRTRGHPLFVVETLRALAIGEKGIPESLETAVNARVRRAGREVEELLRAAAVLGVAFDPATVAGLLDQPLHRSVQTCGDALAARLLVVAGRDYEFANDLVRDVLYATTPEPSRRSYHRLAADLVTAAPEAVAMHASAAEDWPRAARAWLLAGEAALARAAAADAIELLGQALVAAERVGDLDVRARALVGRARARAAQADYVLAYSDIESAVAVTREAGDQRLEVTALRELGGEVPAALGRPIADSVHHLDRGLVLAASLSNRAMEADLQAWMAVLAANDLRFADSVRHGQRAVVAARAAGDDEALAAALDGYKTSLAYLGEVEPLGRVIAELEPLLRRLGDLFRLHWTVFESSFLAVAAGNWAVAATRMQQALEINRQSGYSAYAAWHVSHLGWLARLTGDYDRAVDLGRRGLEQSREAPHVWCESTAGATFGATLLEIGRIDEAVAVLEAARIAAQHAGADAYLLRATAPLAEATGSREILIAANALLDRITTPPEAAFLAGDACYLAVARAWLGHDEPQRARDVLAPLITAAARVPWVGALADASLVDGRAALLLGQRSEADVLLRRAAELAARYGLPRVGGEAELAIG